LDTRCRLWYGGSQLQSLSAARRSMNGRVHEASRWARVD
jgi:hypothetical protein